MTVKGDVNQRVLDVTYLQELINMVYSDVCDSFEVLGNYEGDIKYSLSLQYLKMSHETYLELKRFYHAKELESYEIDPFFNAYGKYRNQLKEFITERDTNDTWLSSAVNSFIDIKENVDKFIGEYIETSIK